RVSIMAPTYAIFPAVEYCERLGRARASLRNARFEGGACVSPENLYYLTGYDSWTAMVNQQALIFNVGESEPTLLIRDVDLPLALERTWIEDIRTYRLKADDPVSIIARIAHEKGIRERVGIDLQSAAIPGTFALGLIEAFAPGKIEDATLLLGTAADYPP